MFAKYKSVIYESLMVILGCAIFGAGLDAFVLPHKLVSTGTVSYTHLTLPTTERV